MQRVMATTEQMIDLDNQGKIAAIMDENDRRCFYFGMDFDLDK